MTEPLPLRSYDDLHAALRGCVAESGMTRAMLDEKAKLGDGYAAKLLAPVPVRAFGRSTLGPVLRACRKMLLLVDDPEAPRITDIGVKNEANCHYAQPASMGAANMPELRTLGRRALAMALKRNGKKGAKARLAKVTPERRSAIARKAAKARWRLYRKVKATKQYVGRPRCR